jgi:hypothetical protein
LQLLTFTTVQRVVPSRFTKIKIKVDNPKTEGSGQADMQPRLLQMRRYLAQRLFGAETALDP